MSSHLGIVDPLVPMTRIEDWPADEVVASKGRQRVDVILPARNEAATVGGIVAAITAHCGGLVDEIVVVDSASSDATAEMAARAGARVVTSLLPGKGEAMWRGLAETDADVVVFLDADLERFDPRYIPALVGPLLCDPAIFFVKGAYDRDIAGDLTVGGGRVTELTARPLLAAFWPELSDVVQPLGGEYAGRRDLLERLPFRRGYGVDIGLLLDTAELVGVSSIAQVDLHERHHSHSDLQSLGLMAAEVLHTILDRLITQGRLAADAVSSTSLVQPARVDTAFGHFRHEVDVAERPPLRARGAQHTATLP